MDKNIYIVKHSDLIGEISDFPIEVVQKMVERQYEQNGFCDVSAFQINKINGPRGFCWCRTIEGDDFWSSVINGEWSTFFDRYPTLHHKCVFTVVDGDGSYEVDVLKMQKYSPVKRKFAYKNKPGDIYYIDVDRHGDVLVRFALANSALAKEVMEKGVEFGDTTQNEKTKNKLDAEVRNEGTPDSLRDTIKMIESVSFTLWRL